MQDILMRCFRFIKISLSKNHHAEKAKSNSHENIYRVIKKFNEYFRIGK